MEEALKIFNDYYSKFDSNKYGIKMKYDHTMRVVNYSKRIAESLNLSKEDIELACKCGLYHDIARFKQWEEYDTFLDALSFDHGDEGYNILKELEIYYQIILLSTKYHNKYRIDEELDDRTKLFCNITRDADKLDILISQCNKKIDEKITIDESIINCFKNHSLLQNVDRRDAKEYLYILRELAFIFDINYKESFNIIKKEDFVNKKCDLINSNEIDTIRDICNKYIDERVSNNYVR